MNDEDLIRQIRSGQTEVYGDLIRRYHQKVMGSCLSMLNNQTDAEEAAQDIFVKAYQSLGKFKGESSFSTWLYRITSNHCLDILRWRKRRRSVSLDRLVFQNRNRIESMFASSENAASSLENREMIQKILSILPSHYRVVLILREEEGLEFQEIAGILDCSLIAVKGRLARARRLLQVKLGPFWASQNVYRGLDG